MDSGLAAVFRAEAEEHLKVLMDGFLSLESEPAQPELLEKMFRAAHSFKGAARVLGLGGLESLAHRLEDLLGALRSGRLNLSPKQFDVLSVFLDQVGELVPSCLQGEEKPENVEALLASLGANIPFSQSPMPEPLPAAPEAGPEGAGTNRNPDGSMGAAFSVLKVPTQKLDELLNLTGELLVSHQRLKRRSDLADQILEDLEECLHRREPSGSAVEPVVRSLQALAQGLKEDESRQDSLLGSLELAVRRTRLVPLGGLFDQVPKWVRDLSRRTGKAVMLRVQGAGIEVDKRILEGLKDPLLHLVQNAVDHGIETPEERRQCGKAEAGLIQIAAEGGGDRVVVSVQDDGRGVDPKAIRSQLVEIGRLDAAHAEGLNQEILFRQLFLPGFTTRRQVGELSGRGVGLDVVRTLVEELKGSVHLDSELGRGTKVELSLPLSLATTRVLLAGVQGMRLAIPASSVQRCVDIDPLERLHVEGRDCLMVDGVPVLLASLGRLVGAPVAKTEPSRQAIVLFHLGEWIALSVDTLLGEQEVIQKALDPRLAHLVQFSGAALLGDGTLCLVLNPSEIIARSQRLVRLADGVPEPLAPPPAKRSVLLADDSLTTRIQLRRILESAGLEVTLAVDGLDAWSKLASKNFDALVSDVDMPGLDGLGLTMRVRGEARTSKLPVVLVTTLSSPEQQRRGMESGANAYIHKGRFDQNELLETLERLL
jgi:two-component system chemotaxis sensor kinase CheA